MTTRVVFIVNDEIYESLTIKALSDETLALIASVCDAAHKHFCKGDLNIENLYYIEAYSVEEVVDASEAQVIRELALWLNAVASNMELQEQEALMYSEMEDRG